MRCPSAFVAAAALLCSCMAAVAAPRAFVSGSGNDANAASSCALALPCRTLQVAHDVVDAGGEIVALDTAGYGNLLISKSLTVMAAPGATASVTKSGNMNAISMVAGAGRVALRDLNVLNAGGDLGDGVHMFAGEALSVERCTITGFFVGVIISTPARVRLLDTTIRSAANGIIVTQGATVEVVRSHVTGRGATGEGITVVQSNDGTTSSASVSDSTASGFLRGFAARSEGSPNGPVRLSCIRCTASGNDQDGFHAYASVGSVSMMVAASMASGNGRYGFFQQSFGSGTAAFLSLGSNALHDNRTADTNGTITVVGGN